MARLNVTKGRGVRPRGGGATLALAIVAASGIVTGGVAAADGGGIGAPRDPRISDVTCLAKCAGLRTVTEGSTIEIRGAELSYVKEVKFAAKGTRTASSGARKATAGSLETTVPEGASSGRVKVVDGFGGSAESREKIEVVSRDKIPDGVAQVGELKVSPPRAYFAGRRKASAKFLLRGGSRQDVRVDVIDAADHTVVRTLVREDQKPNSPASVTWNGKTDGGEVAPNGEYVFEAKPMAGGGEAKREGFTQYDHKFPVRGGHSYGDGLGAGRGHQGQDITADCGTKLAAARGGKVEARGYQAGGAGNYVVIDGKKTDVDYSYLHMLAPASVSEGERVRTGEKIGEVGSTGRSSGCHLHFEMWSGPGWYTGGEVIDPTPHLKRWDGWS